MDQYYEMKASVKSGKTTQWGIDENNNTKEKLVSKEDKIRKQINEEIILGKNIKKLGSLVNLKE